MEVRRPLDQQVRATVQLQFLSFGRQDLVADVRRHAEGLEASEMPGHGPQDLIRIRIESLGRDRRPRWQAEAGRERRGQKAALQ